MHPENKTALKAAIFTTPLELYRSLLQVWAADTASPAGAWSPENPAQNHCSISALIVHDFFGGDIFCTRTVGGNHFYNSVNGTKWDLTISQFAEPVPFENTVSSRAAALADTSEQKYYLLTDRLLNHIKNR
jgi:hypothetical protein